MLFLSFPQVQQKASIKQRKTSTQLSSLAGESSFYGVFLHIVWCTEILKSLGLADG